MNNYADTWVRLYLTRSVPSALHHFLSRVPLFRTFDIIFQMTESIETGLLLMIVGMSTVFVVLGIVVYTGKFLIVAANRLPSHQFAENATSPDEHHTDPSGAKIAAIVSAIQTVTGGKGQITNIERLK